MVTNLVTTYPLPYRDAARLVVNTHGQQVSVASVGGGEGSVEAPVDAPGQIWFGVRVGYRVRVRNSERDIRARARARARARTGQGWGQVQGEGEGEGRKLRSTRLA